VISVGIGETMEIRCAKAFHLKINIEEYITDLEKLGIEQQTPLVISVPCAKCKAIETYEIYKDRYYFTSKPKSH
jgi:hypothetical protein